MSETTDSKVDREPASKLTQLTVAVLIALAAGVLTSFFLRRDSAFGTATFFPKLTALATRSVNWKPRLSRFRITTDGSISGGCCFPSLVTLCG